MSLTRPHTQVKPQGPWQAPSITGMPPFCHTAPCCPVGAGGAGREGPPLLFLYLWFWEGLRGGSQKSVWALI